MEMCRPFNAAVRRAHRQANIASLRGLVQRTYRLDHFLAAWK